jgi:septal ring factor EnvC (AmiA/AmiB activator)
MDIVRIPSHQQSLDSLDALIEDLDQQITNLNSQREKLRNEREVLLRLIQADQLNPRKDWQHDIFKWDADIQRLLNDTFKLQTFR